MTYTVDELVALAYPGKNAVDKKHRVSVIRAANSVASRLWWGYRRAEHPQAHPLIYYNLLDHIGYAIGRNRCLHHEAVTHAVIVERAAHPQDGWAKNWARDMLPGSAFGLHVDIQLAEHDGDSEHANQLRDKLDQLVRRSFAGQPTVASV